MGKAILKLASEEARFEVAAGYDRPGCPEAGRDLGALIGLDGLGLTLATELAADLGGADVLIDFSAPAVAVDNARACARARIAYVVGVTGLAAEQEAAIEACASDVAIVKSGNMSLGVNLLAALVERAAAVLDDSYDIEILESHHRAKVDAPSGTALMLGAVAAGGRNVDLDDKAIRARDGITGARKAGDIGFAVLRGGGVVGDHSVQFLGGEETLELRHTALDRNLFARGALTAARWAAGQSPGLYDMRDVIGGAT